MIVTNRLLRRIRYYRRLIVHVLAVCLFLDAVSLLYARPRDVRVPAARFNPPRAEGGPRDGPTNTTVFIASVHRNTEKVLRGGWNDAILALVDHLGPENVHFSAVESGSQEHTKEMLLVLQDGLDARGATNSIRLGATVWEQMDELWDRPDPEGERQPGWIWNKAEGIYDLRRIPYLARTRNQAMEPLRRLEREEGRRFDWVFWVNDVIFDPEDFTTLLQTRDGRFAAACSMDFKAYPYYYDTFALRDDRGDKTASLLWPWFMSPTSRAAAQRGEPVPVASCWNGVVLLRADPFYADPQPLAFRGVPDSLADLRLEGSECCLIHADNRLTAMAEDGGGGVWLNPNVRVGYSAAAYADVRAVAGERFPGPLATVAGAWANRLARWMVSMQLGLERRTVAARLDQWRREEDPAGGDGARDEPGEACLINEMQIMWMNGWKHL